VSEGDSSDAVSFGVSFGVPEGVRRVFARTSGATRVVLVRHGEAVCNVDGVVGGIRGCKGLTDRGRRQVTALAESLSASGELRGAGALYASTLPRAIETAELLLPALGEGTRTVAERENLSELHPGDADAMTWQEVIDTFGVPEWDLHPEHQIAPGGESWTGFVARAGEAVRSLAEQHRGELVVAAVHAGVIEATLIHFLDIPPARSRRGFVRVQHASLTEWEWLPERMQWVLVRFNDAHGVPETP